MADRIFISKKNRDLVEKWSNEKTNVLDFKEIENIEKFTFLAALGINEPKELDKSKDGYIRYDSIKSDEKSILSSILLGNAQDDEIDLFATEEMCYKKSELCAETGFEELEKRIQESQGDEELLCKKLMSEIDLLYESKVKSLLEDFIN